MWQLVTCSLFTSHNMCQQKRSFIAIAMIMTLGMFLIYHWASIYCYAECPEEQLQERALKKRLELNNMMLDERQMEMEMVRVRQRIKDLVQLTTARRTLLNDYPNVSNELKSLPDLLVITATKKRWTQRADLTRLAQTLMQVPRLRWIVVEDADSPSAELRSLLESFDIRFSHIATVTPPEHQGSGKSRKTKTRGVAQRNTGLDWLRTNIGAPVTKGVAPIVYFADDDNTYHLRIFQEMRQITRVGTWPVGICGGYAVERPIVDAKGKVVDFIAWYKNKREFPIDMAGFAINYRLIHKYRPKFTYRVGYQESDFLKQIITRRKLEPLAENCTKVWVWHTQTAKPGMTGEMALQKQGNMSNQDIYV